jgi:penicillin amidase
LTKDLGAFILLKCKSISFKIPFYTKEGIMKLFKKILIGLVIVIILAIIAGYLYVHHLATKGIPDYNRDVELQHMKETVTVYRDPFAVPHVYAKNKEDLYRAVGYVMAQDRLWQMDLMRRVTTGRLSEIFGKDLARTDLLLRALRMTEKSKLILSKSHEKILIILEAFTDGINQYIEQNINKLPTEFSILGYVPEKWEVIHSVNLVGYMSWDLNIPWASEILLHQLAQKVEPNKFKEMIPNIPMHNTIVVPDFSLPANKFSHLDLQTGLLEETQKLADLGLVVFNASNNWTVSGKKSATGKPILANDMHLGLFAPGTWYQMHQVVETNGEEQLNVTGLVLPGQPFIIAGHNHDIAWGMTNVMLDDMDFYLEKINPENPYQYRFNGEWKDMEIQREILNIRGGHTIEKELKFTHRGPVISGLKGINDQVISMHWIGNEYSDELRSVYLLNRAKNWEDFREAVKTFIAISLNIAYADVHGNIGMQICAGVPIRKGDGITVAPGETDEYDWTGIVPFKELPYSFNPKNGHVSSANNKSVNDDYPYYISHWFALPDRINRIREMLVKVKQLSIDDFKRMHGDFKSKHVERFLGDIITILKETDDLNESEKKVFAILSSWNGVLSKENTAATIFEHMYMVMVKNLVEDELGETLYRRYLGDKTLIRNLMANTWKNKNSQWCDNIHTKRKETFNDWIRASFKDTIRLLQAKLGSNPDKWQWGKLHKLILRHPLGRIKLLDMLFNFNRGPFGVGGSFHTVCPYSYSLRNPFISDFGASHRHIYSTANWDESQTVIPTGTSGIPSSPFYCDQTKLYIENKYHNDFFSKPLVVKNAKFKMMISGKEKPERN